MKFPSFSSNFWTIAGFVWYFSSSVKMCSKGKPWLWLCVFIFSTTRYIFVFCLLFNSVSKAEKREDLRKEARPYHRYKEHGERRQKKKRHTYNTRVHTRVHYCIAADSVLPCELLFFRLIKMEEKFFNLVFFNLFFVLFSFFYRWME